MNSAEHPLGQEQLRGEGVGDGLSVLQQIVHLIRVVCRLLIGGQHLAALRVPDLAHQLVPLFKVHSLNGIKNQGGINAGGLHAVLVRQRRDGKDLFLPWLSRLAVRLDHAQHQLHRPFPIAEVLDHRPQG